MLVVEPARAPDMDPVARLAQTALRERYSQEWLEQQAGKGSFYVARDISRNSVVGFALAQQNDCDGHLLAIAVDSARRGQGIGRALVGHVRQELACSGAMRLHLEVRADDRVAQHFYRQMGFQPEKLQTDVYSDGGDALVMTRPL